MLPPKTLQEGKKKKTLSNTNIFSKNTIND